MSRPGPGRIGAAFRSVRRSTRSSKKGRSAAEKGEALEERMSVGDLGEDLDHARGHGQADGGERLRQLVRLEHRADERVCGEVRLAERIADRLAEEQVLADRGVVVVASDVEGIDEPVEPVRRERGRTDRRASTMAAASFGSRIGSRVPARPQAWISRSRPAVDTASARRSSRSGSLEREP